MGEDDARIIKRYANRKLYDTQTSRYVTLDQVSAMIREGVDVTVLDNNSKEDLTSVTLAQIIYEEEKRRRSFLPLSALRRIVQGGGGWMSHLTGSAGRVFQRGEVGEAEPVPDSASEEPEQKKLFGFVGGVQHTVEGWKDGVQHTVEGWKDGVQHTVGGWKKGIDANISNALGSMSPLAPIQKEVQRLRNRVAELEAQLAELRGGEPEEPSSE